MDAVRSWVAENKLTSVGSLWASAVGASLVYSHAKTTFKPSIRFIHARMYAQAATLAVLSGTAAYHYYQNRSSKSQSSALLNNNE